MGILWLIFMLRGNQPTENSRIDSSPLSFPFYSSVALRTSAVQVYRNRLRVKADFFFFLSLFFFFFFRGTKTNCSVFVSFFSLYAHLPYHKTVLQRLPLFCKIHTNSASSENLCYSPILRFSMFSFSVAESSLTYIF